MKKVTITIIAFFLLFFMNNIDSYAYNEYGFEGEGTVDAPYLIENIDDLICLQEQVNGGTSFSESYFLQTEDIDLHSIENWTPIGIFDTGRYFYGIYNGGGHKILNLTISSDSNAAFFGVLGGTVMNLEIASGEIQGSCVGSIASHAAAPTATIINCMNSASIYGERTGGIADNFEGIIVSSYNFGTLNGIQSGGIVSFDCTYVIGCISNYHCNINADSFCGTEIASTLSDEYEYFRKQFQDNVLLYANSNQQLLACFFEGEGKESNPFLLSSYSDWENISNLVEIGCDFVGMYFVQTKDISFPANYFFTPIGDVNQGKFFGGTINGNGYTLANLNISQSENAALFDLFGGCLINLGIESGTIQGKNVASFINETYGKNVRVLNCFSKVYLSADENAYGVAINFDKGIMENCWTIENSTNSICSSADTLTADRYIINCFLQTENDIYIACDSQKSYSVEIVANRLNNNIIDLHKKFGYVDSIFLTWDEDELTYSYVYDYEKKLRNEFLGIYALFLLALFGVIVFLVWRKQGIGKNNKILVTTNVGCTGKKYIPYIYIVILMFGLSYMAMLICYVLGFSNISTFVLAPGTSSCYTDFFEPLYFLLNNPDEWSKAYTNIASTYPPVARFVVYGLGKILPIDIQASENIISLRNNTPSRVLVLMYIEICLLFIAIMCKKYAESSAEKMMMIFIILNTPMLFLIERGNILLLTFALSMSYILNYNSDNKVLRELSFLALAIAASLKLYPAILGLLLIRDKRWKETLRCATYGFFVFVIPFAFIGGLPALGRYINNVLFLSGGEANEVLYKAGRIDLRNAILFLADKLTNSVDIKQGVITSLILLTLLFLVLVAFFAEENWKAVLALTLILVMIPGYSIIYMAVFYTFPLLCVVKSTSSKRINYAYTILLCLLLVPLQYLHVLLGIDTDAIRYITSIMEMGLLFLLFVDVVVQCFMKISRRK